MLNVVKENSDYMELTLTGIIAKHGDGDMVGGKDGFLWVQNHLAQKKACFASGQIWYHCVSILFIKMFVKCEGCVGLKVEMTAIDKRWHLSKELIVLICHGMVTILELVIAIEHPCVDRNQAIECVFEANSIIGVRYRVKDFCLIPLLTSLIQVVCYSNVMPKPMWHQNKYNFGGFNVQQNHCCFDFVAVAFILEHNSLAKEVQRSCERN